MFSTEIVEQEGNLIEVAPLTTHVWVVRNNEGQVWHLSLISSSEGGSYGASLRGAWSPAGPRDAMGVSFVKVWVNNWSDWATEVAQQIRSLHPDLVRVLLAQNKRGRKGRKRSA